MNKLFPLRKYNVSFSQYSGTTEGERARFIGMCGWPLAHAWPRAQASLVAACPARARGTLGGAGAANQRLGLVDRAIHARAGTCADGGISDCVDPACTSARAGMVGRMNRYTRHCCAKTIPQYGIVQCKFLVLAQCRQVTTMDAMSCCAHGCR